MSMLVMSVLVMHFFVLASSAKLAGLLEALDTTLASIILQRIV